VAGGWIEWPVLAEGCGGISEAVEPPDGVDLRASIPESYKPLSLGSNSVFLIIKN
tara:strand:+ start:6917 stop:7081 length:165 start_codon:yes stop_codon:yes gene_type:complete